MSKTSRLKKINQRFDEEMNESIGVENTEESDTYTPQFRMYGDAKIPVSKNEGKLWQTRFHQSKAAMKDVTSHWDKALKYFNIDQIGYRFADNDDTVYAASTTKKLRKKETCKENVIFTNVMGMLPNLYSQNPTVEITPEIENEQNLSISTTLERLLNVILQTRTNPGVNMQPKARKGIINSMITNRGILKIGWTNKNLTNADTLQELDKIRDQLLQAKEPKEIEKLEGQLIALNEMVDFSEPSCLYVQHIQPIDLFVDPTAQEQDGTDAKWMIERTYLPTMWIKAKFGIQNEDNDETRSVYKPTHVLKVGRDHEIEEEYRNITDQARFDDNYGYDNTEAYKKSQLTECFWIWDKVKRRVYLYTGSDWEYPLWVYDDPYHLQEFFPYYILNFIESPNSTLTHGEISLYVDQQDEINKINAKLSQMRDFGFNHYLFNSNIGVSKQAIEKWANGGETIVPIALPEGVKFEDVLFTGQVPYDKNQVLYDKGDLLRQIDAASGTDATIRSGEYKTNTTNMAIQTYMAGKNVKMDDKRDLIERWLGQVGWGLAQLVLQFMTKEQVGEILSDEYAQSWNNYTAEEIRKNFSLDVVGGSTQRPNSAAKQQQALQITQLLGQFASATPMVVIVMLKMLSRAFDSFIVKEEDIQTIIDSIQQQIQAQQMQAQAQAQQQEAQANLANEQANTEIVDQAANIQQASQLPESVQNTILNNVMNQPSEPAAIYGQDNLNM
ncbi:MAG: hypothetical protein J6T10_20270 [Methanobrevibacter sp.]|nr:hypothetical protein [Methanobrevibacter sp.]